MKTRPLHTLGSLSIAFVLAWVASFPVPAKDSHFGEITFPNTTSGEGHTGGSTSLPALVGNRDRNDNFCLGFGDPIPDYILVLDEDVNQLAIQVDSQGHDTTLIVQGPDERTLYCADDTELGPDARLTLPEGKAGRYRIWVGAAEPGVNWTYKLSVEP
ncbi:MAG TPA: hypothetical protein IGS17_00995 [Oscillatoriales cyanobacterium M59_W2019_021]|nr:MAG: hypothetical protein D6728_12155 [Cyanobacteria bacterium J055]HIK31991.1 hypothetical protein [Oscillatoriales cyanobacterium M4454_W2019_049]HIK49491.1 hypothetical protein [Oscillatoriales cyanobacterium M59_W2019_021]